MRIKAAAFDMDGTLLNTEKNYYSGLNYFLRKNGIAQIGKRGYLRYVGRSEYEIEKMLRRDFGVKILDGEFGKARLEYFKERARKEGITLMPHAAYALIKMHSKGIRLALATGGVRDEMEFKVKMSGIWEYFEVFSCLSDVKGGKPYPDVYLNAAQKLQVEPKEIVAFEDTPVGAESAKRANIYTIAIPNEFCLEEKFEADLVVSNLKEAVLAIEGRGMI
ncbi:MAG: HAD family phosphatase [Candidatus Micrarchaeota archaeon]